MSQTGYVHSLETFGLVDGPGVRFIVFCRDVSCAADTAIIRKRGSAASGSRGRRTSCFSARIVITIIGKTTAALPSAAENRCCKWNL